MTLLQRLALLAVLGVVLAVALNQWLLPQPSPAPASSASAAQ